MALLMAIALVAVVVFFNPKLRAKTQTGARKLGLTDPKVLIALGIIVFDLIVWAMVPWLWAIIAYSPVTFVVFNIGFWTALYLRTIKTKNQEDKDTNEAHPIAVKLSNVIAGMLIVGLLTTAGLTWQKEDIVKISLQKSVGERHPLVAIAGCVSNFRQWNDDKSVYIGPGNGMGLLQIPLKYQAEVAKWGDDSKTLEGNVSGGKKLYHKYGTLPWMTDKAEVDCWSRQLPDFRVFVDVHDAVTDSIPVPERYRFVITKTKGEVLKIQPGENLDFIDYDNTLSLGDYVSKLRFLSDKKGAAVTIKFHRP